MNLLKNIRYNKEELERKLTEYVNEQYKQGKITKDLQETLLRGGRQEVTKITERGGGRKQQKVPAAKKPSTGITPSSPKPPVKAKQIIPDEITAYLRDHFGVSAKKATKQQLQEALKETRKTLPYSPEQDFLKKLGTWQKGYEDPLKAYRTGLYYGGIKRGIFTNNFTIILIIFDKKTA